LLAYHCWLLQVLPIHLNPHLSHIYTLTHTHTHMFPLPRSAEGCKDVRTWHECIVLIEEVGVKNACIKQLLCMNFSAPLSHAREPAQQLLPCRRGKELSQWPRACPTAADSLTSMSNAVDYLKCPPIPKSVLTRSKAHWLHIHVDRGTSPGEGKGWGCRMASTHMACCGYRMLCA
jgi:hypothetical protein